MPIRTLIVGIDERNGFCNLFTIYDLRFFTVSNTTFPALL